jgi:hypothetical protein
MMADADQALLQDDVPGDQLAVELQPRPHVPDELAGAAQEVLVHVVQHPAEAVVAVGQPGAGQALQQVEDLLAVVEGVEQRGEPAQVEQEGAHQTRWLETRFSSS